VQVVEPGHHGCLAVPGDERAAYLVGVRVHVDTVLLLAETGHGEDHLGVGVRGGRGYDRRDGAIGVRGGGGGDLFGQWAGGLLDLGDVEFVGVDELVQLRGEHEPESGQRRHDEERCDQNPGIEM
jgi:hypothetical protein